MGVRMYDGAYPPTADQAGQLLADGGRVYAGYLPFPGRALNPWAPQDFAVVQEAGFAAIPIYFGPLGSSGAFSAAEGTSEARDAVAKAQAHGFPSGSKIALDIEPGPAGPYVVAYAQAWAATVREAGYVPGLYAVLDLRDPAGSLCNQAGESFDWVWVACGVQFEPSSADVPGLVPCIGRRAWQYWGTHYEQGASVDRGIADDWFVYGEEANMFSFTDPKNGCKTLCDMTGAVFALSPDGVPDGHYLGGLDRHPEWNAGAGHPEGPVVAIQPWDDGLNNPNLSGYVIITRDLSGQFHNYNFYSDGRYAKPSVEEAQSTLDTSDFEDQPP